MSVIILSVDGSRIVRLRYKEACYCRFEKADDKGRINHVFYGNFRKSALREDEIEVLPLLDEKDPLGDLEVRMGREPGKDGKSLYPLKTASLPFWSVFRHPAADTIRYPTILLFFEATGLTSSG